MFLFRKWSSSPATAQTTAQAQDQLAVNSLEQIQATGRTRIVDTELIAIESDKAGSRATNIRSKNKATSTITTTSKTGLDCFSPQSNLIALNDTEDGFADVAVRPLTYAEAARLAGVKETETKYEVDDDDLYAEDVFDQCGHYGESDEGEDVYEDEDEDDLQATDNIGLEASVDDSLTPSSSFDAPKTPSVDVLGELQYGDRAQIFIDNLKIDQLEAKPLRFKA